MLNKKGFLVFQIFRFAYRMDVKMRTKISSSGTNLRVISVHVFVSYLEDYTVQEQVMSPAQVAIVRGDEVMLKIKS